MYGSLCISKTKRKALEESKGRGHNPLFSLSVWVMSGIQFWFLHNFPNNSL